MHYYQHHIGDFIKDTARLTDSQVMTYLRMLWEYYDTELPLPDNKSLIACKVGSDEQTVSLILQLFFTHDGSVYRHTRCDKEIAGYKAQSEGGKKGAAARWGNKPTQQNPNAVAMATPLSSDGVAMATPLKSMATPMPSQCDLNANHEPRTNSIGSASADKPKRRSRIPENYSPKESHAAKAKEKGLSLSDELEGFKDFHTGKGSVMADWDAAFHTWLRNSTRFGGKKPQQSHQPFLGNEI